MVFAPRALAYWDACWMLMDMLNAQFTTYNEERRWLKEDNRSYAQVTHSKQAATHE